MGLIDLPHGFTPEEFITMLDADGSGSLTVTEFISNMFRLVHCNSFQNMCLARLQGNQVLRRVERGQAKVKAELADIRHALNILTGKGLTSKQTTPMSKQTTPCNEAAGRRPSDVPASMGLAVQHHEAMAEVRRSLAKVELVWRQMMEASISLAGISSSDLDDRVQDDRAKSPPANGGSGTASASKDNKSSAVDSETAGHAITSLDGGERMRLGPSSSAKTPDNRLQTEEAPHFTI